MRTSHRESAASWPRAAAAQPTCATRAWRAPPTPRASAAAAAGGRRPITADRGDFGRELALAAACAPSVILLRQLPAVVRAADVAALLLANLTDVVTSALDAGTFIVLAPLEYASDVLPAPLRATKARQRIGAGRRQATCDVAVCRETCRELQSIRASAVHFAASVAYKSLVEAIVYDFQRIPKPCVAGSNPAGGTALTRAFTNARFTVEPYGVDNCFACREISRHAEIIYASRHLVRRAGQPRRVRGDTHVRFGRRPR